MTQIKTTGKTFVPRHATSTSAVILGWMAAIGLLLTLPLWIGPAIVVMIATGHSLKSCGHKANQLSGLEDPAK